MPSSCQMRAAVFGPSPGSRMKRTTSGGTPALRFVERLDLADLDDLDDLLLDRLADSLQLLRAAVERELRDRARRLAHPRRRAAVGEDAKRLGALELEQVGEEVELVRDVGVPGQRGHVTRSYVASSLRAETPIVCLPTYNERENLEPMLRALAPLGVRVLVIDDNSPDGTGEIADRLAAELDFVSVLHRHAKEGLGPAYLAGFRARARGRRRARPRDGLRLLPRPDRTCPRLIAACRGRRRSRARLPLRPGRRHRELGARAAHRLRGGSFYARVILGVRSATSPAASSASAARVLETIDLDAIDSKGYVFQIETTYRTLRKGFRVVEVPIRFADRTEGESKMSRAIVLEAVWKVPALRLALWPAAERGYAA